MKTFPRTACLGVAIALFLPFVNTVSARESVNAVELLAQATGLTQRQVSMVVHARTPFHEYLTSFDRVERRFRQAVGAEMYEHIKQHMELTPLHTQQLTAMAQVRSSPRVAAK